MADQAALLEVARIDRAHGVNGHVILTLITDRLERLGHGSVLLAGDGKALTVQTSRPHQHRYIVKFAELDSREEAKRAAATLLFARPISDPDTLWVHDLVGQSVFDTEEVELGVVEAVQANPASDLLVLEGGGLIPLRFLVRQRSGGALIVDPPDGLLTEQQEPETRDHERLGPSD